MQLIGCMSSGLINEKCPGCYLPAAKTWLAVSCRSSNIADLIWIWSLPRNCWSWYSPSVSLLGKKSIRRKNLKIVYRKLPVTSTWINIPFALRQTPNQITEPVPLLLLGIVFWEALSQSKPMLQGQGEPDWWVFRLKESIIWSNLCILRSREPSRPCVERTKNCRLIAGNYLHRTYVVGSTM